MAIKRLTLLCLCAGATLALSGRVGAQPSPLLGRPAFEAIRAESSGERPMVDFREIVTRFSGFSPSPGGDDIAAYIAERMKQAGLAEVGVEGFPADGKKYFWTFLTEPAWEANTGTLDLVSPSREHLADFALHRVVLGRFSTDADVDAELIDVGRGVAESDYVGKDVKGKIVLATGDPGAVHARAVWGHGAVGVLWHRSADAVAHPEFVSNPAIVPWSGPHGETPGFSFCVPFSTATSLRATLAHGEKVVLHATVRATTGPGEYKQVSAAIPGTNPALPEVWIYAHDNYRNTGGANNLTGVGATMEIARVLQTLVARGALPKPRRTIRFWWGAEHHAGVYGFFTHPERRGRALAMLNVDMAGFEQIKTNAVFRLYRLPYSLPHFVSDVAEQVLTSVAHANSMSIRNSDVISTRPGPGFFDATFAPSGSRDQWHTLIEDFTGPSDHEDVVDATIGVPAVLYNDWPDPFIGTQEDDLTRIDPTQMRRSVLTVAATAYYLATIDANDVAPLAALVTSAAQVRLAREAGKAAAMLTDGEGRAFAAGYREGTVLLHESLRRELLTLETLKAVVDGAAVPAILDRSRRQLQTQHDASVAAFDALAHDLAAIRGVTLAAPATSDEDRRRGALVPRRSESLRGPVNFFRPEYGLTWLQQKTGDADFRAKVALAGRGHYVLFEALNFADGVRTLQQIRDAVSAEYGPIDLGQLEGYFRFLEQVGVVSIGTAPADRSHR